MRRSPLLDWFHRHPGAKNQAAKLLSPAFANLLVTTTHGTTRGYALVLVIGEKDNIVRSLHDPNTAIGPGVNGSMIGTQVNIKDSVVSDSDIAS